MIESLHFASTMALGLFAGALFTEGFILVPYWRRMARADFFQQHGEVGPRLFRFFAPLTTVTVILAVAAAVPLRDAGLSMARLVAGAGALAVLATFFFYFRRANASFAEGSLSEEQLKLELRRWATWHWARTATAISAFGAAVWASVQ